MDADGSSLRTAWILLVIIGSIILLIDGASASRHDLPEPAGIDRSREAPSVAVFQASMGELQFLPGVGVGIARAMHQAIREQPVRSLDQLESLPGIGPSRADAIRRSLAGGGHD